ncbi:MAG: hypothetical protein ACOX0W_05140 [Sphaerochaetaceae bacterium]|jgi:hypothetical protein
MTIEQQTLEAEYQLTLSVLEDRQIRNDFSIDEVEMELRHLLVYQGQDWDGRGEIKHAAIQGQVYAYEIFIKRYKER